MNALVPALLALLAQTDAPPPAAAEEPAPAAAPATAPATAPPGTPAVPAGVKPQGMGKSVSPQEVSRQLERIKNMPPEESEAAANALVEQFGGMAGLKRPVELPEPTPIIDAEAFSQLPEVEQVKVMARIFVSHLVSADARSLVLLSAFPFQLEDRNLATPEELHKEWLKNLRSKRTDVLTLYGVDVYTPAEMEKKYGRPPARLAALPLRQPRTWIAVANLSGHAGVIVFRLVGAGWQAVAYTD